jgi:hypothetical protein
VKKLTPEIRARMTTGALESIMGLLEAGIKPAEDDNEWLFCALIIQERKEMNQRDEEIAQLRKQVAKLQATIERVREWADNRAFTETNWDNRVVLAKDILKALSEDEAS